MSTIKITHPHQLDDDALKIELNKLTTDMKQRYGVSAQWQNDQLIDISASGVSGQVSINDQSITINLKLNMMLSMMSGKIETDIKNYLNTHMT